MPKIKGRSLAEHRLRTRAALFAALSRLMGERGFDAITLADIAAEADVGRTAVYNHFPDKETLLLAFIENETARYAEALQEALAEVTGPVEKLRVYVRQQAALKPSYHFPPGPDLRQVVSPGAMGRLREHVVLVERILRDILQEGIADGVLPEQDLDLVVQLLHGCLSARPLPAEGPDRDRHLVAAEQFVLRAVGAGGAGADGLPAVPQLERAS